MDSREDHEERHRMEELADKLGDLLVEYGPADVIGCLGQVICQVEEDGVGHCVGHVLMDLAGMEW